MDNFKIEKLQSLNFILIDKFKDICLVKETTNTVER